MGGFFCPGIDTYVNRWYNMHINNGGDFMMYRIAEVAKILGFKERTVRQWIVDGKIKAVKIMSEWRIPEEEIERLKKGE